MRFRDLGEHDDAETGQVGTVRQSQRGGCAAKSEASSSTTTRHTGFELR